MSNPETIGDASSCETKQPIGSSKRKRKSSIIKRNIVPEEKSSSANAEESEKQTEVEKVGTKKMKAEVISALSCTHEESTSKDDTSERSHTEASNENKTSKEESVSGKKSKGKPKSKEGTSHECVNCNFCSEHKSAKSDQDDDGKGKKKLVCDVCAKIGVKRVYSSIEKYKNHVSLTHNATVEEVNRFQCSECPEPVWFPTKAKYTYHLGAKHPGIIKFICEICTKTFKLKTNYKSHLNTHNIVVQKKFSCEVCNGTFVNKAGFEAHKKRFPGPHIKQNCPHCGFSFSREKHMQNHRCKKLLFEEAANRANDNELTDNNEVAQPREEKQSPEQSNNLAERQLVAVVKKPCIEELDFSAKKQEEVDPNQSNKRLVFHRIIARRPQEQTVYRPVQIQAQNVPESVVVQELREIDLEGGTFISTDSDQQIILRDMNGHIVSGNQILQFDLNDVQQGEESQVYLADWNVVAPFVIREKSP